LVAADLPVLDVTRGGIVESSHFGAIAVVDSQGQLQAWYGDAHQVTFLRSSAKPIQLLPFIQAGGDRHFQLTPAEISVMCGSHDGSQAHVQVVEGIQSRVGITETDLLCGIQPPLDESVAFGLIAQGKDPTPNQHNCSGKHTGMLAYARMLSFALNDYTEMEHPVQQAILTCMAEMCNLPRSQVVVGRDGCSVPTFGMPLFNAALAYARLCDPQDLPPERADACRKITRAMLAHPENVAGPKRFDTRLMMMTGQRMICKGGAEGFLAIGLLPGALGSGSPGIGIAIKISDGDAKNRARPAVALELLRQIDALSTGEVSALAEFGPVLPVTNWRRFVVGESHPVFKVITSGWKPHG